MGSFVATRELALAIANVREAERCVQRCSQDLVIARRVRDMAVQRQERLTLELQRIERSVGETFVPGRQMLLVPGTLKPLQQRAKELRRELTAA